jgi:hypothetical protein
LATEGILLKLARSWERSALVARRVESSVEPIKKTQFRASTFLERMQRRRGYDQPYALEDTWGFTVDVAVVTMAFWSLSGIWLWWELKSTRFWGGLSLAAGLGLFTIFLILL